MSARIDLWRLREVLRDHRRLAVLGSIGGGWFVARRRVAGGAA